MMKEKKFIAERISKTADITINGSIEEVFPLFGVFDERKWAKGWDPQLVYPDKEIMEEGVIFTTRSHNHEEQEYQWIVSTFNPGLYNVQYLVSTPNRYWTITVQCRDLDKVQTVASITYSFTSLNEKGKQLNKGSLERMYKENLGDWEEAINHYLANR